MSSAWDWGWLAWALTAFAAFLVMEIRGYASHHTLSETVWRLFGLGKSLTGETRFFRLTVIMSLIWLTVHLASGGWW